MQVHPNQLVELQIEGSPDFFKSRIEDTYDDLLIIGAPIHKGTLVPIRVGTRIFVDFKISSVTVEGRFRNTAIVEKRYYSNNVPLLQLRLLGEWHKTQERSFVRVPVFLDAVFFQLVDAEDKQTQAEAQVRTGIILNISGGGFMLRTDVKLEIEDQLKVSFYIGKTQIVSEAEVARLIPNDEGNDYGLRYLDLPEQIRTTIIRYVYKRQIELAEMAKEERI